jgi:phosphoglycerate dehydrogenase-like enzyme
LEKIKIVVWDNIGNTLLGMRAWDAWPDDVQERLIAEDSDARSRIVAFDEVFADYDVELVWLYDPVKSQRGFTALFEEYHAHLRPVTGPDDIAATITDADFFVLHKEQLPAQALDDVANLRLIQHLGNDYRGVPLAAAHDRGIPVAATPLINYSAVAEHVWAMVLNHLKRLLDQREYMQSRRYLEGWGAYHPDVSILSDLTLGLLGMGEIARPVAQVARAFNMRTVYWDIVRFPELETQYDLSFVEWDDVFRNADVVSVQLALNEKTEGIIGSREFSLMKPTALFVNTARGKLVDEDALVTALQTRLIGGAALDVFAEEPLAGDNPLHALHEDRSHSVILTPHSAAQGPWTWVRDSQEIWFNVRRCLNGEAIRHLVEGSVTSSDQTA